VPNCLAGAGATAIGAAGTPTPVSCPCPPGSPIIPYCNPTTGKPVTTPLGIQDCRKPKRAKFQIRAKQAIGPKDLAGTSYDGDSCIGDWLEYLRNHENGGGLLDIVECTAAATAACGFGATTTWWDDRLVPFDAQDRQRHELGVVLSCEHVADGGVPTLLFTSGQSGDGGNQGQEVCNLLNGQSYPTTVWASPSAWRLRLVGQPAGLVGTGFDSACWACSVKGTGHACSNSAIMVDYSGKFTCMNGSPTVKVSSGVMTVFPSSRFDILMTPLDHDNRPTGPALTVFEQTHIMKRPYGAAGLITWDPPAGSVRPIGETVTMVGGVIESHPCAPPQQPPLMPPAP
jgi:hypothetical protein